MHRDLKLDVIPREVSGEIINPTDVSIVHLYKMVSPYADLPVVCEIGTPLCWCSPWKHLHSERKNVCIDHNAPVCPRLSFLTLYTYSYHLLSSSPP